MSSIMEHATATKADDIDARIAARVRVLRRDRGLSLDALASKSGVSRSMISLIERGESSPTAAVLDRIATALDLPLAALFESAQAPAAPLSRPADRTAWRDPQTGYIRRNISPAGLTGGLQIVDVVLPPRAYVAYENGPELCLQQQVWVQEGRLDVTVGREIYRMAEDDCLAMRLTEPTAFRNPTQRVTRYIVVIASDRAKTARGHA